MTEQTNPEIGLRPVTEDDTSFLEKVYAATRIDEFSMMGWPPEQLEAFFKMQFDFQNRAYRAQFPNAENYLITIGNEKVGRMITEKGELEFRLVDIAILPEYRNLGIGSALINDLLEQASAAGKILALQVLKTNSKAFKLYQRLGFTVEGEDDVYISMRS